MGEPVLKHVFSVCLTYSWSVVRLSSEQFSPRRISDVEILDQEPTTEHLRLAELMASSSTSSLKDLQHDILKKAAKLGASAVVFSRSTTHTEHRIAQGPGYSPWGYNAPYYMVPAPTPISDWDMGNGPMAGEAMAACMVPGAPDGAIRLCPTRCRSPHLKD
jgi:hypothetical protein